MNEFHISRQSRDRYQFDQSLFTFNGNVVFANFHTARMFAQKMNDQRDLVTYPETAVRAGHINAMGLIDEILHILVARYRQQKNPQVMQQAMVWLNQRIRPEKVYYCLYAFVQEFPPLPVYRGELTADEYLKNEQNYQAALEEMILNWIANRNPALEPYLELFDDQNLQSQTSYNHILQELYTFFNTQPKFGPDNQNLIDVLRAPALAHPYSLFDQLEYIRIKWADYIGKYLYRLLGSLDLIKEEEKLPFLGPGPIPIPVYDSESLGGEPENFSPDRDWMPRLVVIAKNTYVWLDQLSKKYNRPIKQLDQIPDEELKTLADWGFSGLWLIGLWERSLASAEIKQLCGNPEAIASAYSLSSYEIANDLGGHSAYENLRDRAWQFGIRLASDMVPNHMGIDSNWVVDHPDWFIGLDYPPFPSYSFNGPNLSKNDRASIFLEDHYFSRSDAAVVFKRVENSTGRTRYIYHGNDGTTMPWNDTAQLDYLNPEVREAVIQTILGVARRFPIIRFDAAMTLAKKHYQRLWFPEPGTGGAIPSRAEFGLTKEQFDQIMPVEFWREVVDRVALEAPDTLLLAEAFWLMEGYFVRTLGMHRVYNSAFMNMLRNEDNANYRTLIKNTLEFEPEILKRYVNFMNNPDERTAVDQFGKGDKYFGICLLMSTLPGLPMFGHGQIEGYSEKYGMEFKRAYWDESVDPHLVERHKREIFPILHRRAVFAGVENFLLYDFFNKDGWVDENVYAFSNRVGNDRALVVYNNKFSQTAGWIKWSTGFKSKGDDRLTQKSLGEGLGLSGGSNSFTILKDSLTGLEFIHPTVELKEKGLFFDLDAYKAYVFVNFREVMDDQYGSYRTVCETLGGRGVPNIEEALHQLVLAPVVQPLQQILNPGYFKYLLDNRLDEARDTLPADLLPEAIAKADRLMDGIRSLTGMDKNREEILYGLRNELHLLLSLNRLETILPTPPQNALSLSKEFLLNGLVDRDDRWILLITGVFLHNLGKLAGIDRFEDQSATWLEEWQLPGKIADLYRQIGLEVTDSRRFVEILRILVVHQRWYEEYGSQPTRTILQNWLKNLEVQRFIGVNRYKETLWFNRESFEELVWWMTAVSVLYSSSLAQWTSGELLERILGSYEIAQDLLGAMEASNFKLQSLLDHFNQKPIDTVEGNDTLKDG